MLRHILFDLALFNTTEAEETESSRSRVLVLLEALTLCNQFYLREHPETPLMYRSGIVYKLPAQFEPTDAPGAAKVMDWLEQTNAPRSVVKAFASDQAAMSKIVNGEVFRDIPRILENGGGDCDNVACWRAAELRHHLGLAAKPYITWRKRPDGGTTYHVVVVFDDGSHEDPSLLLGMGGHEKAAERAEEERKLGERAGEMLAALTAPKSVQIVGELRRRVGLANATKILLGGRSR